MAKLSVLPLHPLPYHSSRVQSVLSEPAACISFAEVWDMVWGPLHWHAMAACDLRRHSYNQRRSEQDLQMKCAHHSNPLKIQCAWIPI